MRHIQRLRIARIPQLVVLTLVLGIGYLELPHASQAANYSASPVAKSLPETAPNTVKDSSANPVAPDLVFAGPSNPTCNVTGEFCIWEDPSTPGALGCRVPLLFIHGIHGNEITPDEVGCYKKRYKDKIDDPKNAPNKCYFQSLIGQLNRPSKTPLSTNYKIYKYHYRSDVQNVDIIGRELGMLLDKMISQSPDFDKEFMIVAHSMGGLVARAYMNLYRHHAGAADSRFKGKMAGDRVMKLITLGTPHHGSALSNGDARTKDADSGGTWGTVLSAVEWWAEMACLTCPNRADLHWNNFDGTWNSRPSYVDNIAEHNATLTALSDTTYDNKIFPYYGLIGDGSVNGRRADLISYGKLGAVSLANKLRQNRHVPNLHRGLLGLGVILERIEMPNFSTGYPITQVYNDGMVTFQSASFGKRSELQRRRLCKGYDHLDMRDGASFPCSSLGVQKPLAQFVLDDLALPAPPPCPRVVLSASLQLSPTANYTVGQPIQGNFVITNRGDGGITLRQVTIKGNVGAPDFIGQQNVNLAPGQSYPYTGRFTPSRAGTYTFSASYEKQDGQLVNPVEPENGTVNKLTINVTESQTKIVVSSSLRITPGVSPYALGQTVNGTFSITNRGNKALAMRQVLIGGRVGDTCPNNVCPDFSPINPNITLNPGQTYNYSGRITLSQPGTYLFRVAYQTLDNKWEMPVKPENGSINQLSILVRGVLPTLTRRSPEVVFASPNDQTVNLYGTKLTKITYCTLIVPPNRSQVFLYIPTGQVVKLGETQIRLKYKFVKRGTYYIVASTLDGQSNEFPIIVN